MSFIHTLTDAEREQYMASIRKARANYKATTDKAREVYRAANLVAEEAYEAEVERAMSDILARRGEP